jgi:hypothetical protein
VRLGDARISNLLLSAPVFKHSLAGRRKCCVPPHRRRPTSALKPPSTISSVPVIYEASSERRKTIALAISHGVP